jgi:hypothetical protein
MKRLILTLLFCFVSHGFVSQGAFASEPNDVAARVDRAIADELFNTQTELAPRTSDATFARRVWLDIVGDIPTPEELTAFIIDPANNKRQKLVAKLLANDYYGQNWARYWRDVILFRALDERANLVANALEADLGGWLNESRAWNEIATEFITAHGDVREVGGTAIMMAQDGQTEEIAAEVSRIFLGVQIACAQCHDHPYDRWKREEFHELAAFFPRVTVRPVRDLTKRSFEVVGQDRFRRTPRGNNAEKQPTAEHAMPDLENPQAPGTQMEAKFFLTSATVPWGTTDSARRMQLADWLTENEWFATAVVNRLWAELVGEGFYTPIDDIGPDKEPTAPSAVKLLADEFRASGYDLKWLIATICQTEAYQRESRPRRELADTAFTANVPQRLRSDQLFNSLLSAFDSSESGTVRGQYARGRLASPRGQFAEVFGYDPSVPREEAVQSIPQVLAMMNSGSVNRSVVNNRTNAMRELLETIPNDDELVTELYLRCLCREPTKKELSKVRQYRKKVDNRREAFEDIAWALVNSAEFQYRN